MVPPAKDHADALGVHQRRWDYVSATNVDGTRHINNKEKEFFYVQRASALGVQERGGERGNNQHQSGNMQDCIMAPSAKEHAEALGVGPKGGDGNNQYQSGNAVNTAIAPSQEGRT